MAASGRSERIPTFENPITKEIIGDGIISDNIRKVGKKVATKQVERGIDKFADKIDGKGITKKTSSWIEHVKSVAQKQKIPYKDALQIASRTYQRLS